MSQRSYVIGIDLGTSHSALAFWEQGKQTMEVIDIPQIQAPGKTELRKTLPSVSYLPYEGELPETQLRLPWESSGNPSTVVGSWAKERAVEVPERAVISAKSWLASQSVDRLAEILPWQSDIREKISPVTALSSYLKHLKSAFFHNRRQAQPDEEASVSSVILTVPASFDEVSRNLTREAAEAAGFSDVQLLEEPQAALYAWIAEHQRNWKQQLHAGDLVLVCDLGGGTTDFSLIAVAEDSSGNLQLERISVGDHLLLGGDNMDLALAWYIRQQLESQGQTPDAWQFRSLISASRKAKEALLGDPELQEYTVSVSSRGAGLLSGTLSHTLTQKEVSEMILEGFFPKTLPDEFPKEHDRLGFQELGLHYESDAAVSRHLARFLQKSRINANADTRLQELVSSSLKSPGELLIPTVVLFNGGVFRSRQLKDRVMELLKSWSQEPETLRELEGGELDLAVAHGATYLGRARFSGEGIRIAAGTGRSYYLGLESPGMAVPGMTPEIRGLCVVPQGSEEGSEIALPEQQFGLMTGKKVSFRFFSSSVRAGDRAGTIVRDAVSNLDETARLELELPIAEEMQAGEIVPVRLQASISEVGVLQLSMKHTLSDQSWDLEFNVRQGC